jgi:hypothetical protein
MKSLRSLRRCLSALIGGGMPAPSSVKVPSAPETHQCSDSPRLKLARADLGIREFPGAAANPAIMQAWKYCECEPPRGDKTALVLSQDVRVDGAEWQPVHQGAKCPELA